MRIKDTEGRYKIDLGVRKIEFNYKGLWVTVASEKLSKEELIGIAESIILS